MPAERRALLAAAAAVAVEGLDSDVPGALGTAVDDADAQIVIRVHELVAVLRDAIGDAQAVAFTYDGEERVVEPYALGTWRNRWYLAGRDRARDGLRRFRLDRIEPATPVIRPHGGARAYVVPDDFDAEAAFDLDPNSWGTDPCMRARVSVGRDHLDAFLAEFAGAAPVSASATRDIHALATPKLEVELDVREYGSFRTRLLAFGANAVVVDPPELVNVVRDHLRALAETR
jgi:predicted DNA-binding transcriptional regulator YafY